MGTKTVKSGDLQWDSSGKDREKRDRQHNRFKNRGEWWCMKVRE